MNKQYKGAPIILTREECQQAVGAELTLDDSWGWVACISVGNNSQNRAINICQISGEIGGTRKVRSVKLIDIDHAMTDSSFVNLIISECLSGTFPNITLVINGDGVGASIIERLYELDKEANVFIQSIKWGLPCSSKVQKAHFYNLRAMASIYTRDAILGGRMSLDDNVKTVEQGSKIPVLLNDLGQLLPMRKDRMRVEFGIPSPYIFDTYCLAQIAEYAPHNEQVVR